MLAVSAPVCWAPFTKTSKLSKADPPEFCPWKPHQLILSTVMFPNAGTLCP